MTTSSVITSGIDDAFRDRRGHLERDERADDVEDRRAEHGCPGGEGTGRDARRDRVGGVVKAVREVEEERDGDDRDERQVVRGST